MFETPGIVVNALGVGTHHPKGHMRTRKGCGDYLFLHFLTAYRIHIDNRVLFREAGDCIIFSPGVRQCYGSDGFTPFGNDWMHVSGPAVRPLLKRLELPVNTLFTPRIAAFIPKALEAIIHEQENAELNWELAVAFKAQDFFLKLGRAVHEEDMGRMAPRNEELHERFNRLRLFMQERCTERWDLSRMLCHVHMSRTSFVNAYRSLFNVSPVKDLINMRIGLARHYLATTDMDIARIADTCGFCDVYYFSRQFKSRVGMTPGLYRRTGTETR